MSENKTEVKWVEVDIEPDEDGIRWPIEKISIEPATACYHVKTDAWAEHTFIWVTLENGEKYLSTNQGESFHKLNRLCWWWLRVRFLKGLYEIEKRIKRGGRSLLQAVKNIRKS